MLIISQPLSEIELPFDSSSLSEKESVVFFDIETTGFSASTSQVYLIGCISYNNSSFQLMQWFAQSNEDEAQLLHNFFHYIEPYKTLITYNGEGFDMPFLINRCKRYQMPYDFTKFESMDLYKLLAPYKDILKLPNLKQKTLETFLGISREDRYHGGELISVYYNYIKKPDEHAQSTLLLHNHDDLIGMMKIYPAIAYYYLLHGNIHNATCQLHSYKSAKGEPLEEAIFTFSCDMPIPKEFSYRKQEVYLTGTTTTCRISVQVYTDELKYFFPNYKDYYYLPMEDISIHKSVAFYVDKNFRTQATAANCYNKKSGRFLPQKREIITPFFKQNYKDKQTYFEINEDFLNDNEKLLLYVKHLLITLSNK